MVIISMWLNIISYRKLLREAAALTTQNHDWMEWSVSVSKEAEKLQKSICHRFHDTSFSGVIDWLWPSWQIALWKFRMAQPDPLNCRP